MTKGEGDWKISKVLEVKEVKVQGGVQRKFRIDWAPTLTTAAQAGKSEKELLNMLVTYKVLGPVDCPENKDKKDCKEMIWEVEGTKGVDGKVTLYRVFYDELLRDHPRELCEYFSQFVQV